MMKRDHNPVDGIDADEGVMELDPYDGSTLLTIDHGCRMNDAFQHAPNVVNRQQGVMNKTPTNVFNI